MITFLKTFEFCELFVLISWILSRFIVKLFFEQTVDIIERNKIRKSLSKFQHITLNYIYQYIKGKNILFQIYYIVYVFCQIILVGSQFVFLRVYWNDTPEWLDVFLLEDICFGYFLIILCIIIIPIFCLHSTKSSEMRDFYTVFHNEIQTFETAKLKWIEIQNGDTNQKREIFSNMRKSAVNMQKYLFEYYYYSYHYATVADAKQRERDVQYAWESLCYVNNCSEKSDIRFSLLRKSKIFVAPNTYTLEFHEAEKNYYMAETEDKKERWGREMIDILSWFVKRIEKIHENNCDIGRNDRKELNDNCLALFDLIDKMEYFISENENVQLIDDMKKLKQELNGNQYLFWKEMKEGHGEFEQ